MLAFQALTDRQTTWEDLNGRIRRPTNGANVKDNEDNLWEDLEMAEDAHASDPVVDGLLSTKETIVLPVVAASKTRSANEAEDEIT